ncbi:MAG TPA: hypothetical protein PKN96_11545 [Flavobacterium sp.]|uniref:hypothetical protein n=1 Tax=Flavobacterium sp. TaxID=239 RepID=UPI002C003F67|nr:hypothetical protein [Flavobacterium sp.]HNP33915.1 hypothetical protein [Flavobacterium sp.]
MKNTLIFICILFTFLTKAQTPGTLSPKPKVTIPPKPMVPNPTLTTPKPIVVPLPSAPKMHLGEDMELPKKPDLAPKKLPLKTEDVLDKNKMELQKQKLLKSNNTN